MLIYPKYTDSKWDAETTQKLILEHIYLIENKKALF